MKFLFAVISLLISSLAFGLGQGSMTSTIKRIDKNRTSSYSGSAQTAGQTLIYTADPHAAAGGCYAGNNWLEFDTQDPSFKDMFALAMLAYSTGKTVYITYDDGFGSGKNCRVVEIQLQ